MKDIDRLQQWIENNERIAFWGASEYAQGLIRDLIDKYPKLVPVCIYDNILSDKSVFINGRNIPVINRGGIRSFDGIKIVMCINSRESYCCVRKELVESGLRVEEDFIDGFACGNFKEKDGTKDSPYEIIHPSATYAPWRREPEFLRIYDYIRNYTLVDLYRCYELWHLLLQTKKCVSGDVLEVGVYKGGTGALLVAAVKYAQIRASIFLCDTFEGVVKTTKKDMYYKGGEHNDTSVELVKELVGNLNSEDVFIIKGVFPEEVLDTIDGKKYRFVHIDVDAYQSAKDIFFYIWDSMVQGGIVVFDDYGFKTTNGVAVLLEELRSNIDDGVMVANLNGHGIFVKTKNEGK